MRKYFPTLLFAIASICFSSVTIGQSSFSSYHSKGGISDLRLDRYDDFMRNDVDDGKIAGAVSLIVRKGEVVHEESFGYCDVEEKNPMTEDNIFYIQSMTKPIVSVAFMMLYEEGHFQLTDKVSTYLPFFNGLRVAKDINAGADGETEPVKREPKIADLLSHTAGFSHGLGNTTLEKDILKALYYTPHENIESRVRTLAGLPMIGHPGEQWYYSASPDVLALLIEHFSGMTTAEFLQARLFDPLGMDDTGYNVSKEKQSRVAGLHAYDENGMLVIAGDQVPLEGNTVFGGTHGLFSTVKDYMIFCRMLLNNGEWNGIRYLSRKSIELMTSNHLGDLGYSPGKGFGLGFGLTTDPALSKAYGSEGDYYWSGAFCTYFFIDPTEELIAILMTQTYPYNGYYGNKMRQFIYQAIVD